MKITDRNIRKIAKNQGYIASYHTSINDFKEWEFSSYHTILKNNNGLLASQNVLDWFGGEAAFERAHKDRHPKKGLEKFIID